MPIVTMNDGQHIDFGSRNKLRKSITSPVEGEQVLTIKCIAGTEHTYTLTAEDPLFATYAMHGLSQKVSDTISKATTPTEIDTALIQTLTQLKDGLWSVAGSGSGSGSGRAFDDLVTAVGIIKGWEVGSEEEKAGIVALSSKSTEHLKLLRSNPVIKAKLAHIASVRASKSVEKTEQEDIEAVNNLI